MSDSGPGWARFTADDTPASIERKMRDAFSPVRAMRWALHPNYRPRGAGGRFMPRQTPTPEPVDAIAGTGVRSGDDT